MEVIFLLVILVVAVLLLMVVFNFLFEIVRGGYDYYLDDKAKKGRKR